MESIIQAKRQIVKVNGVTAILKVATGYPGYDGRMPFKIVTDIHLSYTTRRLKSVNNRLRMNIRNQRERIPTLPGRHGQVALWPAGGTSLKLRPETVHSYRLKTVHSYRLKTVHIVDARGEIFQYNGTETAASGTDN